MVQPQAVPRLRIQLVFNRERDRIDADIWTGEGFSWAGITRSYDAMDELSSTVQREIEYFFS